MNTEYRVTESWRYVNTESRWYVNTESWWYVNTFHTYKFSQYLSKLEWQVFFMIIEIVIED